MWFKDKKHVTLFSELLCLLENDPISKPSISSGVYLLASIFNDKKQLEKYASYDSFDYFSILEDFISLSHGEKSLISLAIQHFGGAASCNITIDEVFGNVDEKFKLIALESIKIRYSL